MQFNKKFAGVVGAAVVLLAGAGIVYAAWSISGNGNGSSLATSAKSLTVTASTGTADMYPGSTGALYSTLHNPNAFGVNVTTVQFGSLTGSACPAGTTQLLGSTTLCVDTGHANCGNNDTTANPNPAVKIDPRFSTATPTAIGSAPIAANGNSGMTLSGALDMNHDANDACQGAAFTANVTYSGVQQ